MKKELESLIKFLKTYNQFDFEDFKFYTTDDGDIHLAFAGANNRGAVLVFKFGKYVRYKISYRENFSGFHLHPVIWELEKRIERRPSVPKKIDPLEWKHVMIAMDRPEDTPLPVETRNEKSIIVYETISDKDFENFLLNYKPFWNIYEKFNFKDHLTKLFTNLV